MEIKEMLLLSAISGTENFNMPLGDSGFADSNSTPFDGGTPITYGAMNIPSDITDVIVYVILNDDDALFDSFTINTDFIAAISLDNGSIFNNVTLVSLGTATANGQRRLYKGTINLTGITNTNLFKLRLTSNGDPTIAIFGVGAYFVGPIESSDLTAEQIWAFEGTGIGRTLTEGTKDEEIDSILEAVEGISSTGLSMSVSTVSFMTKASTKGFNVTNIEMGNAGYNYFQFVDNKGLWHQIRESVDLLETKYAADNPFRKTAQDAWSERTTLTYTIQSDL